MNLEKLIAVAKGETAADLLLGNARIVNTLTAEIEEDNVAISQGRIAGIGDYSNAFEKIDLGGQYLAPGLINGHTHIESSMPHISEYARAVIPRGTSAIVTDLHEIANVSGLRGIKFLMGCARELPMDCFFMAPPHVPSTHMETAGAEVSTTEIRTTLRWKNVIGLGELMNYPSVLMRDPEVLKKVQLSQDKVIDGHAPRLSGKDLNAYLTSGASSDREVTTLEEGKEKLRRGMYLMIREGSSEKNLDELLPLVTDKTYKRCLFVTDDRTCADLLREGEIDTVVRKAIAKGLNPIRAIQMATINTAEHFKLKQTGAIAPGYIANIIVIEDLAKLSVSMVFHKGKLAARGGKALFSGSWQGDPEIMHSFNIKPFNIEALKLRASQKNSPIIEIIPEQIITKKAKTKAKIKDGYVVSDIVRDILKLAVIERHKATGNIGLGLVKGFGLKNGALGSSIAHDSHNIVVAGTNDEDIFAAVKEIERLQGGLVAVSGGKIKSSLALPIAGLLAEEPLEVVVAKLEKLQKSAREMGCVLFSPFATLSFLALPVIPNLRLTDKGLVDVITFKLIS